MQLLNKSSLLCIAFIMGISAINAQITPSEEKEIDTALDSWNDPSKPGASVAVIKDGKIVYLKGFGSANLETNTPITPQTKFQLGEMSKQFTSLAILLLEEQGKIKLNEDIRKYLPELKKYTHPITISHLLNHSSGLYDFTRIYTIIKGTEDILSQAKALQVIASQQTLAFEPGTDFSFHESPTESVLMAEIIARASGQSFADYMKGNIFEPLGMKNSLIRDDSNAILTNVAQPYQKEEGNDYRKREVSSSVIGAINAYSSAEDLAKWYLNFTNPKGALGRLIQKLDTPVQLSNGKKFEYYWGEMAMGREFKHPERGLPKFWNFGMQGGYGANIFRFPEQNILSFALGNNNQYNGGLAMNALNPFLKNRFPLPEVIDFNKVAIKKLSAEKLKAVTGHYWFKKAGYASQLFVENDTLRTKWLFSKNSNTLIPLSDATFQQYAKMEDTRLYKFKKNGADTTLFFTYNDSDPDVMEKYEPLQPSVQVLEGYSGTYYCKEYATLFSFSVDKEKLVAHNLDHPDIIFTPIIRDVFTSMSTFFNSVEFLRDNSNSIRGFKIDTDGIHGLVFEKVLSGSNSVNR